MALISTRDSKVLMDREFSEPNTSASMLSRFVLRDSNVTAFIKLLLQCSKSFGSSYGVFFQMARVADIVREMVLSGFMQDGMEPSYSC